jgi:uncharacterized protein (TIGR03000 family)
MMKRNLVCCAVLILASVVFLALPDPSNAAAMRSAAPRGVSSSSFSYPVYYVVPSGSPVARVPAEEDYAYGASEEIARNAVLINIRVPVNAEVSFDGSKTSQTGGLRSFVTPTLEPGRDYSYEIRARWTEGGRTVVQTRKVNIRAGDRETLNFTARAD